jgi:hypothetical protein
MPPPKKKKSVHTLKEMPFLLEKQHGLGKKKHCFEVYYGIYDNALTKTIWLDLNVRTYT